MIDVTLTIPQKFIDTLRDAERVAVLTGAGISAESGVPTFRDPQTGLWSKFLPQELATIEAFHQDPKRVWEWYASRREWVTQVQPNSGHLALVEMEQRIPQFTLITQNIDNLHQRAGSRKVVELHGNIMRTKCHRENRLVESWIENGEVPPRCPSCEGLLRPDVVWFGEMLPQDALCEALEASQTCELFLSIGTSALVHPAASLPYEALSRGAKIVEINPEPTPLSDSATYVLRGPAGQVLSEIIHAVWD